MKTIQILILTFITLGSFAQSKNDCFKEIKKSEWNYSICIDSIMGVDMSDETQIIIVQFEDTEQGLTNHQLSINLEYNYDNNSLQELWNIEFENEINEGLSLINRRDSILTIEDNQFYLVNRIFENENNDLMTYSSAIGIYKDQYYSFQTITLDDESSLEFLYKVLNRTTFYGEPQLKNDKKKKEDLLNALTSGINNNEILENILLNTEIMISACPEDEKESLNEQLPQIQMMIEQWNQSVFDYIEEMKDFDSVTIKNHEFIRDNSQPLMTAYMTSVLFDCDGEEINYRLICLEINGVIYLGGMSKY